MILNSNTVCVVAGYKDATGLTKTLHVYSQHTSFKAAETRARWNNKHTGSHNDSRVMSRSEYEAIQANT